MDFNIKKIAVLGAGVMGAGIAAHAAGAGLSVLLLDIVPKELTEKEKAKGLTLESPVVRNRIAQVGKDGVTHPKARMIYDTSMKNRIEVGNFEDDLHRISECDWVIEVIVEDVGVKKNFMKEIMKYWRTGMVVSSNTSGVSINRIVEDMPEAFRKNFLGTHFFNPPRYMKLFELIPCEDTQPELLEYMAQFGAQRLGKGIVYAKDTPNFIGNRIGTYATVNALHLMEQFGFDIPTVDALTGSVLGRPKSATFRTLDIVGLDVFQKVAANVVNTVEDDVEAEQFMVPDWIGDMVNNGQLGNKTKQGFYKVVNGKGVRQVWVWDKATSSYVESQSVKLDLVKEAMNSENKFRTIIEGDSPANQYAWALLKNVLLYSAEKVPEITEDYKQIDNAMRWGFNWELGPFEIWDKLGVGYVVERMREEGHEVPAWIQDRLASNLTDFYAQDKIEMPYISLASPKLATIKANAGATLKDLGDGVACLQFRSKSNTITDEVMDMVNHSIDEVEKNFRGLVIGNQGGHFSLGANLMEIGKYAADKNWDQLDSIVHKFQRSNMALKYCRKPVVAAPYGMTLGGGAEVAMHAHKVTAHAETYMGLVEAGVGLVPGGGGTKEMLVRSTEGLKNATHGEMINYVKKAWEAVATGKVSGSAYEAVKNGALRKTDRIVMNDDYLIDVAKQEVIHLSADFVPFQPDLVKVLGHTGRAALQYMSEFMLQGGFISEYDKKIADMIAHILTGGHVPAGSYLTEDQILDLEREVFVSLCGEVKTQQRIEHMLKTGKPLRN